MITMKIFDEYDVKIGKKEWLRLSEDNREKIIKGLRNQYDVDVTYLIELEEGTK